ncbi:molecular chaperone [Colwellia sp. RSH04]|uniref:molecular chaperone n=1 Tax=Colwellia sp. RSH04 TaxID=2305464 RepID=UPI000E56EAFB|nr:molecular chaperone [Colwellia sp. RSH04]RHW77712.1 molecular chaperone [Colwellia sp. RSH04]
MIGFDYGTSNCAVGVMADNQPELIKLSENSHYLPSTLYAPSREVIVNWLYQQLPPEKQQSFKKLRMMPLQKGQSVARELALDGISTELAFGQSALVAYLAEPDEGYYIKSPKSFLGASGLMPMQINLFEDIVAAMMSNIKTITEEKLNREVTQTVIGRPINFQGLKGEDSNQQAINVLTNAAKRVGFTDIEFQYEPVAAGFEFESTLDKETKVLVVDIGGGTTDCSMLLMGPEFSALTDRKDHLLGHSGVRIGGNDFDIQLALKGLMPSFGLDSSLKTNKPVPSYSYWQAMAINNINDQTEFYSQSNRRYLEQLKRDAKQPELIERLLRLQAEKLSYRIVNGAEQGKIALTDVESTPINLHDISPQLSVNISRELMAQASHQELRTIAQIMQQAIDEAQCQPDVIFVTGGTAKSPVINQFLAQQMPNIPVVIGDHFGSVTAGLTRWANRIYR